MAHSRCMHRNTRSHDRNIKKNVNNNFGLSINQHNTSSCFFFFKTPLFAVFSCPLLLFMLGKPLKNGGAMGGLLLRASCTFPLPYLPPRPKHVKGYDRGLTFSNLGPTAVDGRNKRSRKKGGGGGQSYTLSQPLFLLLAFIFISILGA